MIAPETLLRPRPEGLYCIPGDFYVDPVVPVSRALITHGHADHARAGHGTVLATPETLAIMQRRYGGDFAGSVQPLAFGETIGRNGVDLRLAPAGHVLGSAQAVMTWKGMTAVVSGDYKRRRDPTCAAFEPVACDLFVTEATFGLPVFAFPEDAAEIERLLASMVQFPDRPHLIGAYALGKAQRVIRLIREAGYDAPIHVHGALAGLNALYQSFGVALGTLVPATDAPGPASLVIAPPSALQDRWARRFPDPVLGFASGWMRVRARARQRGVELPLVLSDHADWTELTETLAALRPSEVWITHGREEGLLRWCELAGLNARALALVGYEDEES